MALIESIAIERFRGIRRAEIAGLADVNVLIGRNNSGKSSILEAILICAHKAAENQLDALKRDRLQMIATGRDETGSPPPTWWYRRDQEKEIQIHLDIKGATYDVKISPGQSVGSHHAKVAGAIPALGRVTIFDPRRASRQDFEMALWDQIVSRRDDVVLKDLLNELFALKADGFQYSPTGTVMATFPKFAVRVDDQGDGTKLAFRLLLLMLAVRDTALLVEELESYQHPGALQRLCAALAKGASDRNLQLFVTTHSRECLITLLKATREVGLSGAAIHSVLEDGALTARVLPSESVLGMDTSGTDVRFLDLYA